MSHPWMREIEEEWSLHQKYGTSKLGDAEQQRALTPIILQAIRRALDTADSAVQLSESPVEELLALAFWANTFTGNKKSLEGVHLVAETSDPSDPSSLDIAQQAEVGRYRADFIITMRFNGLAQSVAVEVDGHDFHERTKAQASHDKKRDRFFAAQGLTVLRFTGSDVTKDAAACAEEVVSLLVNRMSAAAKASKEARP